MKCPDRNGIESTQTNANVDGLARLICLLSLSLSLSLFSFLFLFLVLSLDDEERGGELEEEMAGIGESNKIRDLGAIKLQE